MDNPMAIVDRDTLEANIHMLQAYDLGDLVKKPPDQHKIRRPVHNPARVSFVAHRVSAGSQS